MAVNLGAPLADALFPVPGRAFGTQEDLDGFRDLLKDQLGEPAKR